jgi:hypothetical protein
VQIKKLIESKTTTISGDMVFHIGESMFDDIPNELKVGDIVGFMLAGDVWIATVKALEPLTLVDGRRNEFTIERDKLIGHLTYIHHAKKLVNWYEL